LATKIKTSKNKIWTTSILDNIIPKTKVLTRHKSPTPTSNRLSREILLLKGTQGTRTMTNLIKITNLQIEAKTIPSFRCPKAQLAWLFKILLPSLLHHQISNRQ